jgi:alpha-tubulin suppressor-like RCC1 family protein
MVRLKMAVAAAVGTGVLASGLAMPPAASADTAQIVYAWGFNDQGQVSVPPVGSHELSPVPIRGAATNVTQLAGSKGSFVLSLRSDGTVWGWGDNQDHQLGDLNQQRTFAPVQIHGLPPGIVQVAGGGTFGAAVAADGSVWAWGANYGGQLGNGSAVADSASPVIVDRRTQNATQIVAGADHAFSVDPDGSLWAWGVNEFGALGLGTVGPRAVRTPQKVPGLTGVTQLAAGGETSMALRSDGTLLVWGYENYGLRGDGIQRVNNLPVPTPVTTVSGVTRIALSEFTVLVVAHAELMPNVVGELRISAVAHLQAIGLSVQVAPVADDPRCDNVGLVESQSPPPGTVVVPGGHATIRVYVPPNGGCF